MTSQIAVIGLGTMGANIARNAARQGATVAIYNRSPEKTQAFIAAHGSEGSFIDCRSMEDLRNALKPPRVLLLMVSAGNAVDLVLEELQFVLEYGDIVIDGGNSHYRDTERREALLGKRGIRFLGLGISGGEEGALHGPSMMAGGNKDAYEAVETLLKPMAAEDGAGGRCISYLGRGGSGHFVKMVHNGIEYGVMQLIAESYAVLRAKGVEGAGLADTFSGWVTGDLGSYLMEITSTVLRRKDDETGGYLVDVIKDAAGQKGTGRWTTEAAMQYGAAIPTVTASVDARLLSQMPEERHRRKQTFPEVLLSTSNPAVHADQIRDALAAATLLTYSQGFDLLFRASHAEAWNLPIGEVARLWRGGCIIRSPLLEHFQRAYNGKAEDMRQERQSVIDRLGGERQRSLRMVVASAVASGVPTPAFNATIAFYDSIRSDRLPQNLIQAQRDFFGAHTYERTDKAGVFHTEWNVF